MIMLVKSLVGASLSFHRRAPVPDCTIWTRSQPIVGYRHSTPLQTRARLPTNLDIHTLFSHI